jgi:hypothetical protein
MSIRNIAQFTFLSVCCLLLGCKNRESRTVNTAFIHWKSRLELTEFEQQYCRALASKTVYVRCFDVDISANQNFPEPIAELTVDEKSLSDFETIIPTVFITNRTLLSLDETKISELSTLIFNKLRPYTEGSFFKNRVEEILIDCDWTASTRAKFFDLIAQLKTLSNKKITATIRLHQIKFKEKTGIPPADKGLLMAYNTGDLSDPKTVNSILDVEVLKSYLGNLDKYPLQLDVALPIFSWGIVKRDGQAVQLLTNFSSDFLMKKGIYTEGSSFSKKSETEIEILKNGYYNGVYLYADDVIKIEVVSPKDLKAASKLLSEHIHNQALRLSFFSLDSANLKRYGVEDLRNIFSLF